MLSVDDYGHCKKQVHPANYYAGCDDNILFHKIRLVNYERIRWNTSQRSEGPAVAQAFRCEFCCSTLRAKLCAKCNTLLPPCQRLLLWISPSNNNLCVASANAAGIDVIITDHHLAGRELPAAFAIVAGQGTSRTAILTLIVFFIAGMMVLSRVNVEEGQRAAREAV